MKKILRISFFVLFSFVVFFITRNSMVLLHEWTHGFFAWLFHLKDSPFEIYYGNWTLFSAHEAVNYEDLFLSGEGHVAGLIGISALITNLILYIISLLCLRKEWIRYHKFIYFILYWFALVNLGELFSYIPFRVFPSVGNGDVGHFLNGFSLSPWILFIPGSILMLLGLWNFLNKHTTQFYHYMGLNSTTRFIHFLFLHFVLFFWFGEAVFHYYGPGYWAIISPVLGVLSFVLFYPSKRRIEVSEINNKIY